MIPPDELIMNPSMINSFYPVSGSDGSPTGKSDAGQAARTRAMASNEIEITAFLT
jgi:hypothetical protein